MGTDFCMNLHNNIDDDFYCFVSKPLKYVQQ